MKRVRSRKGAPGIVEVAKRAEVSPATVSRYFNSPDVVKAPTRKRIEQAALDLGYIRDRMAGALHNGFSGTIGLVVPTIDNAIFAELIDAFAAKLHDYDRTMLIAAHGYNLEMETAIVRSLLERRIDGVAMIGLEHNTSPLEMLSTRGVPALAVWNYRANSATPCVGANNFEAGRKVAEHLIEHGHKDIAFLFPPTASNDRAHDRLEGALSAFGLTREDLPDDRFFETLYDIGAAKKIVGELLSGNRPTALICGNDIIAQGAMFACQLHKVSIPDELSIIGIGDFRGSAHMVPALTTLRLPARRIGELAAEKLCSGSALMRNGVPDRIEITTDLRIRGSVGMVT